MSGKSRRRRLGKIADYQHNIHTPPGFFEPSPDAPKPVLHLFAFGPNGYEELTLATVSDIDKYRQKWPVLWLNIEGFGDKPTIIEVGKKFSLHELALEDAVSMQQRAKVEQYGQQLFVLLRMVQWQNKHPQFEQISMFLGENFLITMQAGASGDTLDSVRDRIRKGSPHLLNSKSDYLLYNIIDAVVDGYFPAVESLGDELEALEDDLLEKANSNMPARVMEMKRDVLLVRRAIWPVRDVLNALMRDDMDEFIQAHTRVYLRDCYDHAMRIIDLVETQREMCSDLMDLYLSSVSNRMNEVMRALTVITLLFMPATLIAGIYGMNFNPSASHLNMPELNWPFGYMYALGLMVLTAGCFYRYAQRKGWTGSSFEPGNKPD